VDIVRAIEMLLPDAKGAMNAPPLVHPMVERPVIGLEIIPAPGPPPREFTFGFDVQIRTVEECGFG
jgi:hypothetical protein